MALGIHDSSNVYVEGVTAKEAWGDGFYQTGGTQGKNINLYSVVAYDNRRQGLSIENVDGMVIRDSVFNNNKGTWPMSGIDLEPYRAEYAVTNIKILNNTMNNNQTGVTHGNPGPNMHISNVLISCNIMKDNTLSGIRKTSAATNEIVSNNTITGSPYPITSTGDTSTVIGQNGGNNPSLCPVK